MQDQAQTRKRYTPEIRRGMILDQTAEIVASQGVAGLLMERISRKPGVSKSLIYRYFDSLSDSLRELLRAQICATERAQTFEQLVRNITQVYLSYLNEVGLIVERLQSEPSVSDLQNPTQYGREAILEYLAKIVVNQFSVPMEIAKAATDVWFGLPAACPAVVKQRR